MLRTFLAVALPSTVREALVQEQQALQRQLPSASWVRPHALHVTLKFLGDTPEDQIEPIRQSVLQSLKGTAPFVVELQGFGVFPDSRAPRILWMGVLSGHEQLLALAKHVEETLIPIGFSKEAKPFHPHVTLARIKKNPAEFGQALSQRKILMQSMRFDPVTVDRLTLFKSELRPTGSVYTHLWDVPFQRD